MGKASHTEVAKRAYAIWEREGRPDGRDFDHWLKAEREVEAEEPAAPAAPSMTAKGKAARTVRRKKNLT